MRITEEPQVGIFWVLNRRLLTDATPVSQGEPYGECLTHPRGHLDVWTGCRPTSLVPEEMEYEEPRRGRVVRMNRPWSVGCVC